MSEHNQNYFLVIPAHILENPKIDDSTALLFGRIASLSNMKGYCFASDEYLASLSRVKSCEIKRRLRVLEDEGYITRDTKKEGMKWNRKIIPNFNYEGSTRTVSKGPSGPLRGVHMDPILKQEKEIDKKEKEYSSDTRQARSEQCADFYFCKEKRAFVGISEEDLKSWKEAYPYVDISQELERARQWILSNPSKSNKKLWRRFIISWISKCNDRAENRKAYKSDLKASRADIGGKRESEYDNLF